MAKKESNEPLTDKSPKYRIRELNGLFYPQWLEPVPTAINTYYRYSPFLIPVDNSIVYFSTLDGAKHFLKSAHKGEVIHSFDPETE